MNPGDVQIDFWNVGQGDASTITFSNGAIVVIDVGPFNSSISRWLANQKKTCHIENLILTHNDADHIGGLETIVNAQYVTIGTAYMLQDCHLHGEIIKIATLLRKKARNIKRLECEKGGKLTIANVDNYSLELRYPSPEDNFLTASNNETSGIIVLSYNGVDCISWGADNTLQTMTQHIASNVAMQFGPHHGAPQDSKTKIPSALQKLDPQRCYISVGTKNRHKHPAPKFLKSLCHIGCFPMCSQVTKHCSKELYLNNTSIYDSCAQYALPPPASSAISCWGHVRFYLRAGMFELDYVSQQVSKKIRELSCSTACCAIYKNNTINAGDNLNK